MVDYYDGDKRLTAEEINLRSYYGSWSISAWVKKKIPVQYGEVTLYERSRSEHRSLEEALKHIQKTYKEGK